MGYNSEHAGLGWIAFDIETIGREDVTSLLPEPDHDKRLTDPAKIDADKAKKRAEQIGKLSVDANGCQLVALGFQTEQMERPEVLSLPAAETFMLDTFYEHGKGRTFIGFYSRLFDLPVILQRSRYRGLAIPPWRDLLAPYGRAKRHIDLFDELTFDNGRQDGVVPRKLGTFCKQFGLDVPEDGTEGADIAALVKAGDYAAVRRHCEIDVVKTVALARALGVIKGAPVPMAASF